MRSIMHNKQDGTCYLCMMLSGDYGTKITQEHHVVFGTSNRRLSERYGLKVYLCMKHHGHDGGPDAVHRNKDIRRMLDKEAQKAFESRYPDEDFRMIFGKNYLDEADREQPKEETEEGFRIIEDGITGMDW